MALPLYNMFLRLDTVVSVTKPVAKLGAGSNR
jgi:hypothetical protein